ncbi:hypothetical protein VZT92_001860 [Zoarces viviparus]|uniref:Rab11 family-interacting protein 2 n=1 Tax=Zoarces viviparus TaxID=48416 RepID=A0AAW1G578_ZOAVI
MMSLGEQSQKWFPTHVQATVLQATGLQPKGKNGTNDAYTIIQLGKEKYSTSVAEKTLSPVWKEEASFELPGLLLEGNPDVYELCLIVMHRSLVGMDKFLGQRSINLNEIFDNKQRKKTDWYSLESKQGKKRKDRGRIQVSIQFMRNNMTASMFDLSMKEKPRSPFSKLKDKMKGRKHDGGGFSDASSAILPRSAMCDSEPNQQSSAPEPQPQPEAKAKRPLLAGAHKLSAAHSMSDLIGTHFRPKLDSMNSIEESGGPHRRSQSEVPGYQDGEAHSDPFTGISDTLPQKYATLPRNRNPFEGEHGQPWDRAERKEKKEKVSLLERVTGKKEGRKSNNAGRSGSSGDLRSPNPFSGDSQADTNPFISSYKASDKKSKGYDDITFGHKKKKDIFGKKPEAKKESVLAYSNLSFEEVVQELIKQKEVVKKKDAHIRELEDYIDNLLVRVMEETPSILRTPYEPKKKAGKLSKK